VTNDICWNFRKNFFVCEYFDVLTLKLKFTPILKMISVSIFVVCLNIKSCCKSYHLNCIQTNIDIIHIPKLLVKFVHAADTDSYDFTTKVSTPFAWIHLTGGGGKPEEFSLISIVIMIFLLTSGLRTHKLFIGRHI